MTERHSDDLTLLLHAALDGELDAAGAMDVEGRLSADLALAAEYTRLIALREPSGRGCRASARPTPCEPALLRWRRRRARSSRPRRAIPGC